MSTVKGRRCSPQVGSATTVILSLGVVLLAVWALVDTPASVKAQSSPPIIVDVKLGSLKTVPTPEPANLNQFLQTVVPGGSVSTSARMSPSLTWSPTFTIHWVITPLSIVGLSLGIVTSIGTERSPSR